MIQCLYSMSIICVFDIVRLTKTTRFEPNVPSRLFELSASWKPHEGLISDIEGNSNSRQYAQALDFSVENRPFSPPFLGPTTNSDSLSDIHHKTTMCLQLLDYQVSMKLLLLGINFTRLPDVPSKPAQSSSANTFMRDEMNLPGNGYLVNLPQDVDGGQADERAEHTAMAVERSSLIRASHGDVWKPFLSSQRTSNHNTLLQIQPVVDSNVALSIAEEVVGRNQQGAEHIQSLPAMASFRPPPPSTPRPKQSSFAVDQPNKHNESMEDSYYVSGMTLNHSSPTAIRSPEWASHFLTTSRKYHAMRVNRQQQSIQQQYHSLDRMNHKSNRNARGIDHRRRTTTQSWSNLAVRRHDRSASNYGPNRLDFNNNDSNSNRVTVHRLRPLPPTYPISIPPTTSITPSTSTSSTTPRTSSTSTTPRPPPAAVTLRPPSAAVTPRPPPAAVTPRPPPASMKPKPPPGPPPSSLTSSFTTNAYVNSGPADIDVDMEDVQGGMRPFPATNAPHSSGLSTRNDSNDIDVDMEDVQQIMRPRMSLNSSSSCAFIDTFRDENQVGSSLLHFVGSVKAAEDVVIPRAKKRSRFSDIAD